MKRLLSLSMATAIGLLSLPAGAQSGDDERVNQLIIYGDDDCPVSNDSEITVCARLDENERYRIPESLRFSESPENQSWTSRVKSFEAVGNFGPLSCTAIGAGGELGCTAQLIEQAYAEKANSSTVRFGELIAKAREERLSTIDTEAAATQARVELIEKEYMDRLAREDAAASAGESPADEVQE